MSPSPPSTPPATSTSTSSPREPSFPAALDDLEHERILAAAGAALFGLPPLRIAHHRIERQLGAGGMGEVFLAHDEVLDRKVAIKLLRRELTRGVAGAELAREARLLARLSHPNVVQVHEFGHHGERAYLVMEYVEGLALNHWLTTKPSWTTILAVFRQAGRGLAAAHARGLVHRDFKPQNVLVGADGRTRVVDFGLARVELEPGVARAGTPRYMAPEQLAGAPIDARGDQFGFCVALAEALWGEPLREPGHPPPASALPPWIWRALRRGLDHDPQRRWPDMPSLLEALDPRPRARRRALVGGLAGLGLIVALAWPSAAPHDPCLALAHELDERWLQRHADPLRTAAREHGEPESAAADSLLAAIEGWADRWRAARVRLCRASPPSPRLAARERCLAHQREQVAARLEVVTTRPELLPARVRELAELPEPERCEAAELAAIDRVAPTPASAAELAELRVLVDRSAAARVLGEAEAGLPGLVEALARAEQLGHAPTSAELLAELARVELLAGSPAQGLTRLELAARRAYVSGDDRLAAGLWLDLAGHAGLAGEIEPAQAWFERASDAWARVGVDARVQAELDYVAGTLALGRGQFDEAELALAAALTGPEPRLRPFVLERQAELAQLRGQAELALALRRSARDAASDHFGPDHPRTAQQRYNLALALDEAGLVEPAELELAHAIASWQRAHVRPHADLVLAHMLAAQLALGEGRLADALADAKRARTLALELGPLDLDTRQQAWANLASVHHARGEFEPALAAMTSARTLAEAEFGPDHEVTRVARANEGISLLELGRLVEARTALAPIPATSPEAGPIAALGLAEIELREGRAERAREQLEGREYTDPLDRLDHALLLALACLRSAEAPDRAALDEALREVGSAGRAKLDRMRDALAITERERSLLGL